MRPSLVILLLVASAVVATADDLRGHSWYETAEEVKQRESAELVKENAYEEFIVLTYSTELFGETVTLEYWFDRICKQLLRAKYIFPKKLGGTKFFLILDALKEKYGEPVEGGAWETEATRVYATWESSMDRSKGKTTLAYETANYGWVAGFKEGTEPTCPAKEKLLQDLKEKL